MQITRFIRIFILAVLFPLPLAAVPGPSTVDISALLPTFAALTPDEQDEQLRDWALCGYVAGLDLAPAAAEDLAGTHLPVRTPRLAARAQGEIAPGRIRRLSAQEAVCIVDSARLDDLPLIGSLFDSERAAGRTIPPVVRLVGFTVAPDSMTITLSPARTIARADLFSAAYGYYERAIASAGDLADFLGKIDDLTFMRADARGVTLGGRKYRPGTGKPLPLEAVAALYQAYHPREADEDRRRADRAVILQQYERAVATDKRLAAALRKGTVTRQQVLAELQRRMPARPAGGREVHVGFSLDPQRDLARLADDLEALAAKDPRILPSPAAGFALFIDSHTAVLRTTAARLRTTKKLEPFLALRRAAAKPRTDDARYFDHLLQEIDLTSAYQAARYDGALQGTLPGMILFYTDLTAKLWALDYRGTAPRGRIRGFRAMAGIKVPRLDWDDFLRLSATRLWFGLKSDGFDIDGDTLIFAPVATRVYAASSDPLYPGKETTPNYQSAAFLGWWDRHYEAVAAVEPEYHRLNQIQKWGCLFTVLAERRIDGLTFLGAVPVTRDRDFRSWYAGADGLQNKVELPFLDPAASGRTTECFRLLRSEPYPLMGQQFFLSGGVSLASRRDIAAKLRKSKTAGAARGPAGRRSPVRATALARPPAKKSAVTAAGGRAPLTLDYRVRTTPCGRLRADRDGDRVKLTWEESDAVRLGNFVDALVRLQEERATGYKSEEIFRQVDGVERVLRVNGGKEYLVQYRGIAGKWIRLKINDPAGTKGYPVKGSGTEPDADIFAGKLAGNAETAALRAGAAAVFSR
jgi:hypothetical protein